MRVLIIEDNNSTAQTIELALANESIVCDRAELGEEGIQVSKFSNYDLIILDILLPDINGHEVIKRLRSDRSTIPILILSGLSNAEEKVHGLSEGADDYLTKPFDKKELVARVKAIIRRSQGHSDSTIHIRDLAVNLEKHTIELNGVQMHFTNKEQSILELLARKKGNYVAKESILTHLYNGMDEPELKIVDVFVCKVRKKLFEASGMNYIETSWGRGYALKDPLEIPAAQQKVND